MHKQYPKLLGKFSITTWKNVQNYLEILRRSKFASSFGKMSW
jgi:hypothetical protein